MIFSKKNISKQKFVLVCEGAGIRGLISIKILLALEDELRMQGSSLKLSDCFDLYVATSTGALIISLIQSETFQTSDIAELIQTKMPNALEKNTSQQSSTILGQTFSSEYSNESLKNWLISLVGNKKFSSLITPCVIPVYDILNLEPYGFCNNNDIPLYKVLLASMVLPQYFSPVFFTSKELHTNTDAKMLDGSIYSVDSSLYALSWISKNFSRNDTVHILSLGTGSIAFSSYNYSAYSGLVTKNHVVPILQVIQNSGIQVVEHIMQNIDYVHYTKINAYLKDYNTHHMYDWSKEYLQYLQVSAIDIVHKNRSTIKKFVQTILENRNE